MRIFRSGYKVNFVDTNDVLVGYDFGEQCCERFGYFFSDVPPPCVEDSGPPNYKMPDENEPEDLADFCFDKNYFNNSEELATFRLIGPRQLYLSLYNIHNGYYSHGFEMSVGGEIIRDGKL